MREREAGGGTLIKRERQANRVEGGREGELSRKRECGKTAAHSDSRGREGGRAREGKRKLTVGGKCREDTEAGVVEEKTGECRLPAKAR